MTPRDILIDQVSDAFRRTYGEDPAHIVAAPGRVNLIGEHCDYNDGLVLPCAIDRETMIAFGPADHGAIRSVAADFDGDSDSFPAGAAIDHATADWKNHIRGVAHFLRERGIEPPAANLAIAGNVPMGAGLSSSASLGVATALTLSAHAGADVEPDELARIAQQSENDFVGCACGIMDQMASACGTKGAAVLIDCQSMERRAVPIAESLAIVIIESGIQRILTDSPFNTRRAECEAAAEHYGVDALRNLDQERLEAERGELDEACFRRARHVVTEIARVRRGIDAFASGDTHSLAEIMAASHASLRDDFQVSIPPIDKMVAALTQLIGDRGGVRMTGAGFGGCLVAVTEAAMAEEVINWVEAEHNPSTEVKASAGIYHASDGARLLR